MVAINRFYFVCLFILTYFKLNGDGGGCGVHKLYIGRWSNSSVIYIWSESKKTKLMSFTQTAHQGINISMHAACVCSKLVYIVILSYLLEHTIIACTRHCKK